jgi:hypothetical protein
MRVVLDRPGLRSALLNLTRIRDRLGSSHTSQCKSMQISFVHHDEWNVLHKSDARGTWRFTGHSSWLPCAISLTVMRLKIVIRTNVCVGSSKMRDLCSRNQILVCEACRTIAADHIQATYLEVTYMKAANIPPDPIFIGNILSHSLSVRTSWEMRIRSYHMQSFRSHTAHFRRDFFLNTYNTINPPFDRHWTCYTFDL